MNKLTTLIFAASFALVDSLCFDTLIKLSVAFVCFVWFLVIVHNRR